MDIKTLTVGPIATNCYVVSTGGRTNVVIDPGFEEENIISCLDSEGKDTTHIIYTHSHWDHTGAGQAIREHTGAEVLMGRNRADKAVDTAQNLASMMGIETSPAVPDRFLSDGDKIKSGDAEFTVAETPGHSPEGITIFCKDAIFCGDTIFFGSIGRTDLPGGDYETLIKSIKEKIFTADENCKLYPGHGPATAVGREKNNNPYFQ
ncbi:MAG: MBL fold metallo-hydrolase [Elusimicrobiota bacterium]|nr:MBL fold metallo-hydrolase [Elusimicrobiota bacterium]